MPDHSNTAPSSSPHPRVDDLARALDAFEALIVQVRPEEWSAPTPCTDWTVRQLIDHVIGLNRVFTALLTGQPIPPRPTAGQVERDPVGTYRETALALRTAFGAPGVLDRSYPGPLGSATGAERLQIRLYDLLTHGWDLACATGRPANLPEDLAERSLAFARTQVAAEQRPGRFAPARTVDERAPAIERLAAFLGRPVTTGAPVAPVAPEDPPDRDRD